MHKFVAYLYLTSSICYKKMRAIRHTSVVMIMISLLVIISHSVIPHHHNEDKIWMCSNNEHHIHEHSSKSIYHSSFEVIDTDDSFLKLHPNSVYFNQGSHICGHACMTVTDDCSCKCNSICDLILSFVHSSIQEIPEHILFLATLPVNYISSSDNVLVYESNLSHDLSYLNDNKLSQNYLTLDKSIIRRGPPSFC